MATSTQGLPPAMYILLGCPGSGKGTFSEAIQSEVYVHISTGDIARDEIRNGTAFGLKYKEAILNHVIGGIPFEEIQKLVEQRLEKALLEQKRIILDGYPKTVAQCELLDTFIQKRELKDRVVFVLLDVKEEDAIDRILYRQTCEKCGKIYNSKFTPAKIQEECDLCQGTLKKRMDDNTEGTKKRVFEFKTKMKPVIEYYEKMGRLNRLDGNSTPDVCLERFSSFHRSQMLTKV